ncbi:MAG: FGGY-family carbohydrate kinase [Terriglobia bacterium]
MGSRATEILLGIDVGTGGARAVAATAEGEVRAESQIAIADSLADGTRHEQDPQEWWPAASAAVRRTLETLGGSREDIVGVAVTSTSGSLVLTDSRGQPLRPAILYDDARGAGEAAGLNQKLLPEDSQFNPSFSLVKALWVRRHEPGVWEKARCLLHPTDWLTAKLSGGFGTSDESNALKLGYDSQNGTWGRAVELAGLPIEMLPRVVTPGTQVGAVSKVASEETGLPEGVPVLAGATDGMAGLVACGASEPGNANTTLGTTIVWKILSETRPRLAAGMYCHRHPAGLWAPGAASNTGPGSLRAEDANHTPADLDRLAGPHLPCPNVCYLLRTKGERFPFVSSDAETFFEVKPAGSVESWAAQLQSLAFVERWGYERLQESGVIVGSKIFSTGSAAASGVLSQTRANVMGREIIQCRHAYSAFGAAILAASTILFGGDLRAAIRGMTHAGVSYAPDPALKGRYDSLYGAFRDACARRGYR